MRPITNEDIKVLGRIVNISTENVVADASQVYDSNLHKDQQWLNNYFDSKTGNATTSNYGIVRLAASKNDPDIYDVPTIKILRDAIQDAISFILEDPGNTLLDNLNSIKELADALNNDPSFWTWVRDQLALKADKSAFDTLVGRVDNLNQRVTYLEECCQQMHEYVNEFSVTWNQARGGNHVTITPGYVRIGSSVVEINMDPNYVWEVDTTNASQLHTLLENCMDGDYDSFTITNVTRQAGFVNGMTLNFVGVRSNITINGNVYKLGTITARVTGGTASPTSQMWGSPAGNTRTLTFSTTASSGYTTNGVINWALKDQNSVTVATNNITNNNNNPVSVIITDSIQNVTCFQDYTLEITLPELPSATIIWNYDSSEVNASSLPASVQFGQTVTVTVTPKTQIEINFVKLELYVGGGWIDFSSTVQNAFQYNSSTGQISISYNQDIQDLFDHVTQSPYKTTIRITIDSYRYYTVTVNYNHSQVESTVDTYDIPDGAYQHNFRLTPKTGYQIDSVAVTCEGHDITDQTNSYGSSTYDPSTGMVNINSPFRGNYVVTVMSSAEGTTPTYGTVTISPDHGTASPATCQADDTPHTITITPASGYTTTDMRATSNNNDVSVSVSGDTITVTGTSSNNATISVVLPATTSHITNVSPASFEWVSCTGGTPGVYGENRVIAHVILPETFSDVQANESLIGQYITVNLSDNTNFTSTLLYGVDENDNTKTKVTVNIWSGTYRDNTHSTLSETATITYTGDTTETVTVPLYKYGYPCVTWNATMTAQTGRTLTKDGDAEYTLTLPASAKSDMKGALALVNVSAGLRYTGNTMDIPAAEVNPRIYEYADNTQGPGNAGVPACDLYDASNIYLHANGYSSADDDFYATYITYDKYLSVNVYDENDNLLSSRVIGDGTISSANVNDPDYTTALDGSDFKVALDYKFSLSGNEPLRLFFLTDNASEDKYVVKITHTDPDHGTSTNGGEFILNVEFEPNL